MQARHNQMEMDDDEEELGANSIDRLQEHGINVADINKLKSGGKAFIPKSLIFSKAL